jgi:hypothetical protein
MPDNKTIRDWTTRSSLIFDGKIIKTNSSLEPLEIHGQPSAVIEIGHLIWSRPIFAGYTHQQITGVFSHTNDPDIRPGEPMTIFASARIMGRTLTVDIVGFERIENGTGIHSEIENAIRNMEDNAINRRADSAVLVIIGKVNAIHPFEGHPKFLSEHDPGWKTAEIGVQTVLKGVHKAKTIQILFASSEDIRWFKSPKLHEEEHKVFLLHERGDQASKLEKAIPENKLAVVDPLDVLLADAAPKLTVYLSH